MGPKKKPRGKASKLARMSEEEKQRYLQHRAAIEQEATRRKQQLISTFLKNKLKHEEGFTRLNSAKINQQWRQTLRQIKCKELHDLTENLKQTFNVAIQTKSKIIENLLANLKDSETQHSMAVEFHLETIEKLLGVHKEKLKRFHSHYVEARRLLLEEATLLRKNMKQSYEEVEGRIKTIIFLSKEQINKDIELLISHKTENKKDMEIEIMWDTVELEERMCKCTEKIENEIDAIKKNYSDLVHPVRWQYMSLKSKYKNDLILIDNNNNIIKNFKNNIARQKKCLEAIMTRRDVKLSNMRNVCVDLKKYKDQLRRFLIEENKAATKKLINLSATSDSTLKQLEKLTAKAEQIKMMIRNCNKYLTIREKVLPSICPSISHTGSEADSGNVLPPNDVMRNFWFRHSEVVLECNHLEEYKRQYQDERNQLKSIMKHYFQFVSDK